MNAAISGPLARSSSRRAAPEGTVESTPKAYNDSSATRGLLSRAAVRSATSTSLGTGRDPRADGPADNAASAAMALRFSTTRPTRLRVTTGSARKMFSSAAIASS